MDQLTGCIKTAAAALVREGTRMCVVVLEKAMHTDVPVATPAVTALPQHVAARTKA